MFVWQKHDLFSSEKYSAKNLLFKDSAVNLVQLPSSVDSFLYLGAEYMSIIRSLQKGATHTHTHTHTSMHAHTNTHSRTLTLLLSSEGTEAKREGKGLRWCAVGTETKKCDSWSISSMDLEGNVQIECETAPTVDECIKKIMVQFNVEQGLGAPHTALTAALTQFLSLLLLLYFFFLVIFFHLSVYLIPSVCPLCLSPCLFPSLPPSSSLCLNLSSNLSLSVKRQMPWHWTEGRCTLLESVAWFRSWWSSTTKVPVPVRTTVTRNSFHLTLVYPSHRSLNP